MENANPPPTRPVLPAALRARYNQELQELLKISAFVDSRLESFLKFTAYLDPFLPMNIISRKAYNTIMVDRLEGTGKNLVAIVRDVYVFVGSFTYITDFVVLKGETLISHISFLAEPFVDSRLKSIERFLNRFTDQPNETSINDPESDDGSVDTPLVSPFPHSDNDLDDEEVLHELGEYENAGTLRRERIINSFDGDDLTFECMIGFRKFTTYLDPFLPMNIISRKAYNTIMVDRLEGTGKNLVAIVRDIYMFVKSFTYITDFAVLEDIGEFIMSDMAEVLMGKPFRKTTKLKYDVARGLVSFTKTFDTYTCRMPRTIPRLKNFNWSRVSPLLELSQNNLMNGLMHPYENNKFMYKNCLNLGPEYQVNESMKEWIFHGHVSIHETM
ncbi:hypothetical protein Tco_1108575 [Tanacetum coccineum]